MEQHSAILTELKRAPFQEQIECCIAGMPSSILKFSDTHIFDPQNRLEYGRLIMTIDSGEPMTNKMTNDS